MNSKLDASFFVEQLTWKAIILAKKTRILAVKLANFQHKTGQFPGCTPRETHGPLHDRAWYSVLPRFQCFKNKFLKLTLSLNGASNHA